MYTNTPRCPHTTSRAHSVKITKDIRRLDIAGEAFGVWCFLNLRTFLGSYTRFWPKNDHPLLIHKKKQTTELNCRFFCNHIWMTTVAPQSQTELQTGTRRTKFGTASRTRSTSLGFLFECLQFFTFTSHLCVSRLQIGVI